MVCLGHKATPIVLSEFDNLSKFKCAWKDFSLCKSISSGSCFHCRFCIIFGQYHKNTE